MAAYLTARVRGVSEAELASKKQTVGEKRDEAWKERKPPASAPPVARRRVAGGPLPDGNAGQRRFLAQPAPLQALMNECVLRCWPESQYLNRFFPGPHLDPAMAHLSIFFHLLT